MYKCLVIIPHYTIPADNLCFLRTCVSMINEHNHPSLNVEICIVEQSCKDIYDKVIKFLSDINNVNIITCKAIDAGYPIDVALNYYRDKNMDYVCTLDADCFPVNNLYFYLPIKLIERYNYSYVGSGTDLCYWGYLEKIQKMIPNQKNWHHINNYYRISKFQTALKCSDDVGFMRINNRYQIDKKFVKTPIDNLAHCDNGVIAQWYADYINQGDKLSLEITTRSGLGENGIFGMNIENLVYHVVFGYSLITFLSYKDKTQLGDPNNNEALKRHLSTKSHIFYKTLTNKEILTKNDIITLINNSEREGNGRRTNFRTPISKEVNDFIDSYLLN